MEERIDRLIADTRCIKIYKRKSRGRRKGERCGNIVSHDGSDFCDLHQIKPKRRRKKKKKKYQQFQNYGNADVCSCCSNNIENYFSTVRLPCNHHYHFQCLMILLKDPSGFIVKYDECPVCKYKILEEMERDCPICLESLLEDIVKTRCNHFFHNECLEMWKHTKHNCPICRKKV